MCIRTHTYSTEMVKLKINFNLHQKHNTIRTGRVYNNQMNCVLVHYM